MQTSLTDRIQKLIPPLIRRGLRIWLTPHSIDRDEAFRERNLRVLLLLGVVAFCLLFMISLSQGVSLLDQWWYFLFFGIASVTTWAIHTHRIRLAGHIATTIIVLVLLDPSAAYWSPGTVILGVLFSFLFLMILPNTRELIIPLTLNISIYVFIVVTENDPSPLSEDDFFSYPLVALATTLIVHVIILGMGFYIRHDQAERDKLALMIEQQKGDVLRQFISNASHDLNTPLTRIKTDLYLLSKSTTDEQQPRLAHLEENVSHLEKTLHDMLEMSRLDSGIDFEPRIVDLHHVIINVVPAHQTRATTKNQTLSYIASDHTQCKVRVDEKRLHRAIGNIIDNAITFTPEEGNITVDILRQEEKAIIEVTDNGIGIAADSLPHIFERFYRAGTARTNTIGKTGLGLSISKKIIDMHNGDIEVESTPHQGSTFRLILPLARE